MLTTLEASLADAAVDDAAMLNDGYRVAALRF